MKSILILSRLIKAKTEPKHKSQVKHYQNIKKNFERHAIFYDIIGAGLRIVDDKVDSGVHY